MAEPGLPCMLRGCCGKDLTGLQAAQQTMCARRMWGQPGLLALLAWASQARWEPQDSQVPSHTPGFLED